MVSSDLKLLRNERWIFSKVVKISDFRILSGWIEKYKPALNKSDSSSDNSCWVRLVIVSLSVNIGKLQSLVSEDHFFCWVYNDFSSDFLLYNVIESCVDKKFFDRLSSFERCWSSLLHFLMALRIDKASLLETFGSLKIRNFGYTLSCLQLMRKLMSNLSLFFFYSSFSNFPKSLTVAFPYFHPISL